MGLLDRLLGRPERPRRDRAGDGGRTWPPQHEEPAWSGERYSQDVRAPDGGPRGAGGPAGRSDADARAVERYRYLLRTAPPETIEQAHAEAFAQLTPEQRRAVLEELSAQVPPGERSSADDPHSLARMATRAEMRNPGTLERSLGRPGAGMAGMGGIGMGGIGMGGMIAGSLLASVAGAFVGTAIADAMFDMSDAGGMDEAGGYGGGDAAADGGDGYADGGDGYADAGGGDFGGGDFGGDFGGGDFGGDFGGDLGI